ncbi:MAG: GNAT N-acetyltransferase [Chloroflexi bacterium]|nr:GNAT N-acetyltransferase [Chloroflexota bacterium]
MTVRVRRAVAEDTAGYIALIKAILVEDPPVDTPYAPDEFDPAVEAMAARIDALNAADNSLLLVALQTALGPVIGALTCGGGPLKSNRHTTELGVYVAQPWRDRGVGSALMREAIRWAQLNPVIERVELEVFAGNARAIHVYERFGFTHEGRKRRLYYRGGAAHDMLIMALLLDKPPIESA